MTVLAARHWQDNASLMIDVARLYLRPDMVVLDPTWGKGLWWNWWSDNRPAKVVGTDIRGGPDGAADFTCLPFPDETFDAVAFDPPYVVLGGRKTSTVTDFKDRYGLDDAPRTVPALLDLIAAGVSEASRVVKPGGVVLVKCMDFISSGRLTLVTHDVVRRASAVALTPVDVFHHVKKRPGPQPRGRRQVHARRNVSTLFVFKAGRA